MNASATVFISYGREDGAFVRRLQQELTARDRSTWVDWEGIPPSAEWMQSVYAAIEHAEAFIFVISPDSIASEICSRELRHASERGKKLIPVLHRDVAPQQMPAELASRQWVLLRVDDDFEQGLASLIEALDTDLEWVALHTRLLVRAIEWKATRGDKSVLLRGNNLLEAERWLAQRPGTDQIPTQLHAAFIAESRGAASHRQRMTLAGVVVLLGLAIAAAVTFYLQYRETEKRRQGEEQQRQRAVTSEREAIRQRDAADLARIGEAQERVRAQTWAREAEEKARLARVRQLAAESRTLVAGTASQEAALASAVQAVTLAQGDNEQALAGSALQFVLDRVRGPRLIRGLAPRRLAFNPTTRSYVSSGIVPVRYAVMSSTRQRAATLHGDGTASLWDSRDGRRLAELKLGDRGMATLFFQPGGDVIAGGDDRGLIGAWDSKSGRQICTAPPTVQTAPSPTREAVGLTQPESACDSARQAITNHLARDRIFVSAPFRSPDGSVIVQPTPREGITLVDAVAGHTISKLFEDSSGVHTVRISRDNRLVFTAGEGRPRIWDVLTGQVASVLTETGILSGADFSADGRQIVTAGFDGTARVWSTKSGQESVRLSGHADRVLSATFAEDDQWIVTASADGSARVWNAIGGTVIRARRLYPGWVRDLVVSRAGDRVATSSYEGPVHVWNVKTDTLEEGVSPSADAIAFSPDEREIAAFGSSGLTLTNLRDRRPRRLSLPLRSIADAAWVHGTNRIVAISSSDGIAMWDAATDSVIWRVADRPAEGHRITTSPRGTVITATLAGEVRLWRPNGPAPVLSWKAHQRAINRLTLSPDGQRLLTAGDDGFARIWDVDRGTRLHTLRRHEGGVTWADFSPDGNLVLTTGSDGVARICTAASGQCSAALSGHSGTVLSGSFSPDAGRVLTLGDDNTARVWDVSSGQPLAQLSGHVGPMTGAAFVNDGRGVVTTGQDGLVILHEVTIRGLLDRACQWLRHQPEWDAVRLWCR